MSAARGGRGRYRLAAVARVVRRVPGGARLAGATAQRVRSSPALREALSRLLELDARGGAPSFLAGGHLLTGLGVENLPVVVIDLVGLPAEELPTAITAVAREQLLTGGFRPVVLTDDGAGLGAARNYGYAAELVISETSWTQASPWGEYVADRIASIMRFYPASWTVRIADASRVEESLTMLRALTEPRR